LGNRSLILAGSCETERNGTILVFRRVTPGRRGAAPSECMSRFPTTAHGEGRDLLMRVVIAEDDSIVELGLRRMLTGLGHRVVGSGRDGKEAIRLVHDLRPDLAVLDVVMPDVGGLEAANTIMDETPMPILMLSAFTEHNDIKKAAEYGAFAYLVKPVSMKQLEAAIELAVARFEEQKAYKDKAESLEHELEDRKLIDRARQVLAKYLGISESEALRRMQAESRRQRRKIADTAKAIIATCDIMSGASTPDAPDEDEQT
jgi:AmiR/NasT family two-component response regulator